VEDNVQVLESEVVDEILPYLNKELQRAAETAGWPKEITEKMSVTAEGGDLLVSYPDDVADKIEELEYGTQTKPPRAVIRPFISRQSPEVSNRISEIAAWLLIDGEI
jgi:hypothetical protein